MADLDMMREYVGHVAAQEWEEAMSFFSDDFKGHVNGRHRFSGTYEGAEAFRGYIMAALGAVDSASIESHDLLVSDDHAVVLASLTTHKGGDSMTTNRVVVYHTSGDKISEIWIIDDDPEAVEDFLG